MRTAGVSRRALLGGAFALGGTGCRSLQPMPELEGGWLFALGLIGVHREPRWTGFKVRPPQVLSASHNLRMERGRVTGVAGGRLVNLQTGPTTIDGTVARRSVHLDVQQASGQLDVWGTWAGARLDLISRDDLLQIRGLCCGEYDFVRTAPGPDEAGFVVYEHARPYSMAKFRLRVQQPLVGRMSSVELSLLLIFLVERQV
jgi:hypothetical protein